MTPTNNIVQRIEPSPSEWILTAVILIALDLLLLVVGNELVLKPDQVGLWWPATGLRVAAYLMLPRRYWTVFLPLSCISSFCVFLIYGDPVLTAICFTIVNLPLGPASALVLKRFADKESVDLRKTAHLLVFATIVCGVLNMLVGFAGSAVAHYFYDASYWLHWRTWVISNAVGIILVTPLLLLWRDAILSSDATRSIVRPGALVPLLILLGSSTWIFGYFEVGSRVGFLMSLVLILSTVWVSYRHGAAVASLLNFLICLSAILFSKAGYGPFALIGKELDMQLIELQGFMLFLSITGLVTSALWHRVFVLLAAEQLARARLHRAEAASKIGLWEWERATGGMYASRRVLDYLGVTDNQLPPVNEWHRFCHPDHLFGFEQALADHLQGKKRFSIECQLGQENQWYRLAGESERSPSGEVVRMSGSMINIHERVELEEQLRQNQKLDALGRLTGGIAHDFNNILGGIIGATEILRSRIGEDNSLDRFFTIILSAAERATSLTRRMMTFARKSKASSTPFDINDIVNEVVDLLGGTIAKEISICCKLADEKSIIVGDPTQIQTALLNLGVNARDAMPKGGTLTFHVSNGCFPEREERGYEAEQWVRIQAIDTGSGIPPEVIKNIFDPFFTTKDVGKGTGLGLAAVYGAVKEHNGSIEVTSELGKGTTFTMYFPRHAANSVTRISDKTPKEDHSLLRAKHILLVEDEMLVRDVVASQLEDLGCHVTTATSGPEALEILRQKGDTFHVVLTDLSMPKMNGMDFIETWRRECAATADAPSTKFIVMSGYVSDSTRERLKSAGVDSVIGKPASIAAIASAMLKVLLGKPAGVTSE